MLRNEAQQSKTNEPQRIAGPKPLRPTREEGGGKAQKEERGEEVEERKKITQRRSHSRGVGKKGWGERQQGWGCALAAGFNTRLWLALQLCYICQNPPVLTVEVFT